MGDVTYLKTWSKVKSLLTSPPFLPNFSLFFVFTTRLAWSLLKSIWGISVATSGEFANFSISGRAAGGYVIKFNLKKGNDLGTY